MNFKVQKSECSESEPLFVYSFQALARLLCRGGGGKGECLTQKSFPSRVVRGKNFEPSRGSRGMLPQKIFKIQGPRLAKNAFSEISAWKN